MPLVREIESSPAQSQLYQVHKAWVVAAAVVASAVAVDLEVVALAVAARAAVGRAAVVKLGCVAVEVAAEASLQVVKVDPGAAGSKEAVASVEVATAGAGSAVAAVVVVVTEEEVEVMVAWEGYRAAGVAVVGRSRGQRVAAEVVGAMVAAC